MTSGQTAGTGVPHIREINSNCCRSSLAWKIGLFTKNSPNIHLTTIEHRNKDRARGIPESMSVTITAKLLVIRYSYQEHVWQNIQM